MFDRRKTRGLSSFNQQSTPDYWPSYVDVMTSFTLILFLVMAILVGITLSKSFELDQQKQENEKLVQKIEEILKKRQEKTEELAADLTKAIAREQWEGNTVPKVESNGLILRIVDANTVFESDKSELNTNGIKLARIMATELETILLSQEKAQAEGLTDDVLIESFEVIGHADSMGKFAKNRSLSSERSSNFVESMLQFYRDQSPGHDFNLGKYFKASNYSEYLPFHDQDVALKDISVEDEKENSKNRRIEFVFNFNDKDFEKIIDDLKAKPVSAQVEPASVSPS